MCYSSGSIPHVRCITKTKMTKSNQTRLAHMYTYAKANTNSRLYFGPYRHLSEASVRSNSNKPTQWLIGLKRDTRMQCPEWRRRTRDGDRLSNQKRAYTCNLIRFYSLMTYFYLDHVCIHKLIITRKRNRTLKFE